MSKIFFLDRKFSPGPSLIVGTSFFVFLVLGWLLTSEDQRVDGWLLQTIISLQTDCFIAAFFSAKIFSTSRV